MKILWILIIPLAFAACYYDSQEYLYPSAGGSNTPCDTSNITFSKTIQPILSQNCYACHSNANYISGGGYKLEDYADVKSNSSRILGSVQQTGGYPSMPPAGKLDDCSVTKIKIWINAGAPNN